MILARRIREWWAVRFDPWLQERDRESRQFDRTFGVSTRGTVPVRSLRARSAERRHAGNYAPVRPGALRPLLDDLPLPANRFTFVDYGSGKGRALLIAARYPFRRVVGIEFDPGLHAIAEANIRRYHGPRRCGTIEALLLEATEFRLPDEPSVLFFFQPFDLPVLRRVLEHAHASLQACPREMYLVAQRVVASGGQRANRAPGFLDEFARQPWLRLASVHEDRGERSVIYRSACSTCPPAPGSAP